MWDQELKAEANSVTQFLDKVTGWVSVIGGGYIGYKYGYVEGFLTTLALAMLTTIMVNTRK